LNTVKTKKIAQVVGVNPKPEIYNTPIPKEIMSEFYGEKSQC
jgi:hypothetical protein